MKLLRIHVPVSKQKRFALIRSELMFAAKNEVKWERHQLGICYNGYVKITQMADYQSLGNFLS